MSEQDVEKLRLAYEDYARGNFWTMGEMFDPEVEWHWANEFTDMTGAPPVSHGIDEVIDTARQFLLRIWESYSCEAEELIRLDEGVLVLTHLRGRLKGSPANVEKRAADVWTFRDGRAIRIESYTDRGAAYSALGLSPPD
jgi:ketosteroid isomerase-like protein